jgi:ribosomal protein L16 Arg81 hydroxylase
MSTLFESILAPISRSEFREDYYGKRPLLIPGHPEKFAALFTWDDLNRVLNGSLLPHKGIEVSDSRGRRQPVNSYALIQECRGGASLAFRDMHLFEPRTAELVRALEAELGERTTVNLYASQPSQAAFPVHYDLEDVIVLHLHGRKAWRIFESTTDKPTAKMKARYEKPPSDPIFECELSPGDVLYLPRGHWHQALAQGGMSLQLVVAIEAQKGTHFLTWLVEELENDVRFRHQLPLSFSDEPAGLREQRLREHLAPLEELLVARLREEDTIPSFIRHRVLSDEDARTFKFPVQLLDAPASQLNVRRFARPARQRFLLDEGPSRDLITLSVWGHIFYFPNAARPLLEFVFSQTEVAYEDALRHAGELSEEGVRGILDPLMREGILEAARDA